MSGGVPVGRSHGVRGQRKSARVADAVALLVVALALAAASLATGIRAFLWAGLVLGVVAALLAVSGRQVRKAAPAHAEHPRLDHPEDHP